MTSSSARQQQQQQQLLQRRRQLQQMQLIVKTMVWILFLPNTPASRRLRFPARTADDDDDDNNNNARDDDANNNYDDDGGADERTSFSINDGNDVFQFNSPLPTRKKTLLAERSPRERAAAAAAAAAAETAAAVHRRGLKVKQPDKFAGGFTPSSQDVFRWVDLMECFITLSSPGATTHEQAAILRLNLESDVYEHIDNIHHADASSF